MDYAGYANGAIALFHSRRLFPSPLKGQTGREIEEVNAKSSAILLPTPRRASASSADRLQRACTPTSDIYPLHSCRLRRLPGVVIWNTAQEMRGGEHKGRQNNGEGRHGREDGTDLEQQIPPMRRGNGTAPNPDRNSATITSSKDVTNANRANDNARPDQRQLTGKWQWAWPGLSEEHTKTTGRDP
ncbi:hypothetical protein ACVWXN_006801 [Bradyrhizobium sp. i1.4.4]